MLIRKNIIYKVQPCDLRICYTYHWHNEEWNDCSIHHSTNCGQGVKRRVVTCRRGDHVAVDNSYCNETLTGERPQSEKMCGTPCPGDCVVNNKIFSLCTKYFY